MEDTKQNVLNWNAHWLSQHGPGQAVKTKQKTPKQLAEYFQHTGRTKICHLKMLFNPV